MYNVLVTDIDEDVLLLLLLLRSLKSFLSSLGPCSPLTELAKGRENHVHTQQTFIDAM